MVHVKRPRVVNLHQTVKLDTLIFIILTLSLWKWKFEKKLSLACFPRAMSFDLSFTSADVSISWGLSYSRYSHQQRWPKFGNSSLGVRCLPSSWTSRQFLGKTMSSYPKSGASEGHRSWSKLLVARMEVIWGRGGGWGSVGGKSWMCQSPCNNEETE